MVLLQRPHRQQTRSGGGSVWLLEEAYRASGTKQTIDEWIASERRLLLHAGGQSRRLPAYAPSGKVLTPIPVYRWERGQKLSQNLLQLQIPLYERLMEAAPDTLHTMIVSGDVLIRTSQTLPKLPEADVVCLRTVARCRSGNKPRSIRLRPQNTCTHEVHAAKAVG